MSMESSSNGYQEESNINWLIFVAVNTLPNGYTIFVSNCMKNACENMF